MSTSRHVKDSRKIILKWQARLEYTGCNFVKKNAQNEPSLKIRKQFSFVSATSQTTRHINRIAKETDILHQQGA